MARQTGAYTAPLHEVGEPTTYKIPRPQSAWPQSAGTGRVEVSLAPDRQRGFIALSAELTGFADVELLGTGAGDVYANWLAQAFGDVLEALLNAWMAIEESCPPRDREAAVRDRILADPKLGPFGRGLIALWYTATWAPMPDAWSAAYGKRAEDADRCFGSTYPEGLMWRAAIGAHPEGAKPTGFGTWAFPPTGADT